mmetsp:Transcript_17184/g.21719  ORF Transcript_17184/g.21719 Transcript_17184/m.21719 type:complete len:145 (-) Transcript_17184:345-779(-)
MATLYVVTVFLIVCRRRRRSSLSPSSSPANNKYGYNGIHEQEHGNEDFNEMTANEIHNGKKDLETSFDESNYTSSSTASPPNDSLNNDISGSDDDDDDDEEEAPPGAFCPSWLLRLLILFHMNIPTRTMTANGIRTEESTLAMS